jgi:hypothetical protein
LDSDFTCSEHKEINVTLNLTELLSCEICGSHGGVYENDCLVANNAVNFWQMKNFSFSLLIYTIFGGRKGQNMP